MLHVWRAVPAPANSGGELVAAKVGMNLLCETMTGCRRRGGLCAEQGTKAAWLVRSCNLQEPGGFAVACKRYVELFGAQRTTNNPSYVAPVVKRLCGPSRGCEVRLRLSRKMGTRRMVKLEVFR